MQGATQVPLDAVQPVAGVTIRSSNHAGGFWRQNGYVHRMSRPDLVPIRANGLRVERWCPHLTTSPDLHERQLGQVTEVAG
jgi:hypothetical protein